jgi:type IV secretion system protein VirD4
MGRDTFEDKLTDDLPRGLDRPPLRRGDRGVWSHWLPPEAMQPGPDNDWVESSGLIGDAFMLGRRRGRVIGWKDDRHLLTVAGSRSGKGVSLIIPNLISYQGSALVIDPKGELAAITGGRRGSGTASGGPGLGQAVYVLDPFGTSGRPQACFNPLAELDPDSRDVVDDTAMCADALIVHAERDRHWTETAQALLQALILLTLRQPPERRNLLTFHGLLTLTDALIVERMATWQKVPSMRNLTRSDALIALLMEQESAAEYGHICCGVAQHIAGMGENERGSVLSTARTQTGWMNSKAIRETLGTSDFRLADLKTKKATVYLCLPATRMGTYSRWLRLMIGLALRVMERTKPGKEATAGLPVLFVLDEFPVLRYMEDIEIAAGQMAGFGVKLWVIVQNVGQLVKHYERAWQTFDANSGLVTAFGNSDTETLRFLSEKMGATEFEDVRLSGVPFQRAQQSGEGIESFHRRDGSPLLAPHEIRLNFARRKNRALVLTLENDPAIVERFTYHAKQGPDWELFRGLYDEPEHKEAA